MGTHPAWRMQQYTHPPPYSASIKTTISNSCRVSYIVQVRVIIIWCSSNCVACITGSQKHRIRCRLLIWIIIFTDQSPSVDVANRSGRGRVGAAETAAEARADGLCPFAWPCSRNRVVAWGRDVPTGHSSPSHYRSWREMTAFMRRQSDRPVNSIGGPRCMSKSNEDNDNTDVASDEDVHTQARR